MTPPRCIRVVVANVQRRRRISSPIKKPLLCGGTWFRKLTGRRGGKSPRPQESPFERRRCQRPGQFAARKVASFLELELWAVGMQYGGAGIRDRGRQAGSQAGRQAGSRLTGGEEGRFRRDLKTVWSRLQQFPTILKNEIQSCGISTSCAYAYTVAYNEASRMAQGWSLWLVLVGLVG
jgi:hypothetical protein